MLNTSPRNRQKICLSKLSKLMLSILTSSLFVSSAFAYKEPGILWNISSWETPEYHRDWGLRAINASTAYAMGVTGKNIKLGFVDSGLLMSHPEFQGGRFFAVKQIGTYGKDGMRYPDAAQDNAPFNPSEPVIWDEDSQLYISNSVTSNLGFFKKGEKFNLDGGWISGVNDAHGVNVASVLGANRDGSELHGIAFNAQVYSINTGGNDNMTYGPNQDYQFFLQGYNALADQGVKFINNSWGSNRRLSSAYAGATGWDQDWVWDDQTQSWELKAVEYSTPYAHINLKDLESAKKAYYQFILSNEKSFIDAAYEVAKNKEIVQVFTAGNRTGMKYPFTRAMLPYFRPDIEKYWVNVTGMDGDQDYPNSHDADKHLWNESRGAKWWTIAAPANNTRAANVNYTDFKHISDYGKAGYIDDFGGTSGAAPHITAALGLLQERYSYMSPSQVREVLFTTARQTQLSNPTQPLAEWTAPLGTPDDIWGWGIVDLNTAMFGPKQFLGTFDITLNNKDIWSNDISDIAIKYRKIEDESENQIWQSHKTQLLTKDTLNAEEKAELEVEKAREQARISRQKQGYNGHLIKRGQGELILLGNNTFTGNIHILQGKLTALNQSVSHSKQIIVESGAGLEIIPTAQIEFPSTTGWKPETRISDSTKVNATIKQGAIFIVNNGINNLALTFEDKAILKLAPVSKEHLKRLAANLSDKLSYTATGQFINVNNTILSDDYAFFNLTKETDKPNQLTLVLKGIDMEDTARSNNEKTIAQTIKQNPNSLAYETLLVASKNKAKDIYAQLSNDRQFMIQNHHIINSITLKNHLKYQDNIQQGALNQNSNIWTTTMLNQIYSHEKEKITTNNYSQILGTDTNIFDNSKIGVFVGVGKSKYKSEDSQNSKAKQTHFGVYHSTKTNDFTLNSGVTHSRYKHDENNVNYQTNLTDIFTDIAYNAIEKPYFSIEPYLGISYTQIKSNNIQNELFTITQEKRDLGNISLGLRPNYSFNIGETKFLLDADFAYHSFFGDTSAKAYAQFYDLPKIQLSGYKLNSAISSKLGISATLTEKIRLNLSYIGIYSNSMKSNGVTLNFNWLL